MEKGKTDKGALRELAEQFNMKTCAIVTLDDIIEFLHNRPIDGKIYIDDEMLDRVSEYWSQYGCTLKIQE